MYRFQYATCFSPVRLSSSFVQRTANQTLFSSAVAVVFGGVSSLFALVRDGWTSQIEFSHQNCIVILFVWSSFTNAFNP